MLMSEVINVGTQLGLDRIIGCKRAILVMLVAEHRRTDASKQGASKSRALLLKWRLEVTVQKHSLITFVVML